MSLESITAYMDLVQKEPMEFNNSELFPLRLMLDREKLSVYEHKTGVTLGNLSSSPWNIHLRDLVVPTNGEPYPFERIINANTNKEGCRGTVALLRCIDGWLMNRQFRHATRSTRGWEIESPRGYLDDGCTPEENIMREIAEETGLDVNSCTYLGDFIPDTGLSGGIVRAYLCEIDANGEDLSQRLPPHDGLQEGVGGYAFFDDAAFEEAIASGEIRDGMTLSAWALLKARENASMRSHGALVAPGEAEGDADAQ